MLTHLEGGLRVSGYVGGFVLTFMYGALVHGWSPLNISVVYVFGPLSVF